MWAQFTLESTKHGVNLIIEYVGVIISAPLKFDRNFMFTVNINGCPEIVEELRVCIQRINENKKHFLPSDIPLEIYIDDSGEYICLWLYGNVIKLPNSKTARDSLCNVISTLCDLLADQNVTALGL